MKSVLISIRPYWVQKILSGEKTIEIRKTSPKIEPPFKCFIYETMGETAIPWMDEDGHMVFKGRGEVVAEFICDKITEIPASGPIVVCCGSLKGSAMSREEFDSYIGWDKGFGWHISNLKVYEKPRPLSDFHGPCGGCDGCDTLSLNNHICLKTLKRAPQSWGYVQDIDGE